MRLADPPYPTIACKWSDAAGDDLRGLRAFRRAYPEGWSFVVTSDVERPYVRALGGGELGGKDLHVVGLTHLVERLSGEPRE